MLGLVKDAPYRGSTMSLLFKPYPLQVCGTFTNVLTIKMFDPHLIHRIREINKRNIFW